jgi:hypothetical protein
MPPPVETAMLGIGIDSPVDEATTTGGQLGVPLTHSGIIDPLGCMSRLLKNQSNAHATLVEQLERGVVARLTGCLRVIGWT